MRQLAAAIALSILAIAAMLGLVGNADAADLQGAPVADQYYGGCGAPREQAIMFKEHGLYPKFYFPTEPGRTPYYTCVTGTVLVPGDIPPPPEYCCG